MTTASVPTTQSSPNLVNLVVSSSGYVVFGGTNYIVATPTSSLSLGQPRTLSATPLVGIAYNTSGTVIFGDSVGEVYEVSPSTLSTINLYFQASSTFSAFTIDYVHNVLFAAHYNSSGDMFIARIELDNFSLFGRLLLSGTGVIGAGVFDNSANVMYWGSNQNYVYTVTPTNCTALGCIFCVDDPNYCGFCDATRACTTQQQCPSSSSWSSDPTTYSCPLLQSVVPNAGSIDGNTLVTITSIFSETNGTVIAASDTSCLWNGVVPTPALNVTLTNVMCKTPTNQSPGVVSLQVVWRGFLWAFNSLNFTFYDCRTPQTCGSCINYEPDCGWCLSDFSCRTVGECGSSNWTQQCPAIVSVTPPSVSIRGGTSPIVIVSPFLIQNTYTCAIGSFATVSGLLTNSTAIQCNSIPSLSSASAYLNANGSASINTSFAIIFNNQTVATFNNFLVYDCNLFQSNCGDCIDAFQPIDLKPDCAFCYNTQNCTYYADSKCNSSIGTCPYILAVIPSSVYYLNDPVTTIDVIGEFAFVGENATNLVCAWDVSGFYATVNQISTNSITINNTLVTCNILPSLTIGSHRLSIWSNNSGVLERLTDDFPFLIYDCSPMTCGGCVGPETPDCRWCLSQMNCVYKNNLSCSASLFSDTQCPVLLSITPNLGAYIGGDNITFNGVFNLSLVTSPTVQCNFTNGGLVNATYYSDTEVICISPPGAVGVGLAYLVVNGRQFTNALNFTYYDCTSGNSNCSQCLMNPRCVWCSFTCDFSCSNPSFALTTCPVVSSIVPNYGYYLGGEYVTVHGGPFFPSQDFVYTVLFGEQPADLVAKVPNDQSILNVTTPTRQQIVGQVPVQVLLNGGILDPNSNISFTFFQCNSFGSTVCIPQCPLQQYCGWCVTSSACAPTSHCDSATDLWISQCFTISVSPNYASISGNQTITITFTPDLASQIPSLFPTINNASSNSTVTKRNSWQMNNNTTALYCNFQGLPRVPATIISTNTITCTTPSVLFEGAVSLTILWNNYPLTSPVTFTFVDCTHEQTCAQCTGKTFCGWCQPTTGNATCTTFEDCSAPVWNDKSCPPTVITSPIGLIVGLSIAGALLIGGAIGFAFFLRWRKRRGLVIELKEPDYTHVAFQSDLDLQYKITCKDNYKELEDILMSRDRSFITAVARVTLSTELDSVSKAITYLCHRNGQGTDIVQYFCCEDARAARNIV
jgi:hypothetical protein